MRLARLARLAEGALTVVLMTEYSIPEATRSPLRRLRP